MTETVKPRLLTSGCLCGLSEDVIHNTFSIQRCTEQTNLYFKDVHLLLYTLRQQFANNCWCQVVGEASLALLHDPKWFDFLLKQLTNAESNNFVVHSVLCTATEVALCFDERQLTNLIDELIMKIVEPRFGQLPSEQAITVLGRILDEINNDSAKTLLLLNKLNESWMKIWKSVSEGTDSIKNSRFDVIRLWNSIMVAQTAETIGPCFYSELLGLEDLIFCTDTNPKLWMSTICLFGASLHLRSSVGPKKFTYKIATDIISKVPQLLFFMEKIKNIYFNEHDRKTLVQETVMLVLRSVRVAIKNCETSTVPLENIKFDRVRLMTDVINRLDSYIKSTAIYDVHVSFIQWAVLMMYDHDDTVIELLMCTLDVASTIPELRLLFDPFVAFTEFLARLSFDQDVLLDYLISDENDFLEYLMRVLKAACLDIHWFFRSSGGRLTDIVDLLTRLRLKLLRLYRNNVFPYNIKPLTELIKRFVMLVTMFTAPTAPLMLNDEERT